MTVAEDILKWIPATADAGEDFDEDVYSKSDVLNAMKEYATKCASDIWDAATAYSAASFREMESGRINNSPNKEQYINSLYGTDTK